MWLKKYLLRNNNNISNLAITQNKVFFLGSISREILLFNKFLCLNNSFLEQKERNFVGVKVWENVMNGFGNSCPDLEMMSGM